MSDTMKVLKAQNLEPNRKQTKADVTPVMTDQGLVLYEMIKHKWSAATLWLHPKVVGPEGSEALRSFSPSQLRVDEHRAVVMYSVKSLTDKGILKLNVEEYLTRVTFTLL